MVKEIRSSFSATNLFSLYEYLIQLFPNYGTWRTSLFCSHPWEVMVEAAYRKYPNPHNPNVRTLDTLERHVDSVARRLFSHRLFSTMWSIPTVVMKVRHMTGVDTTDTIVKIIWTQWHRERSGHFSGSGPPKKQV